MKKIKVARQTDWHREQQGNRVKFPALFSDFWKNTFAFKRTSWPQQFQRTYKCCNFLPARENCRARGRRSLPFKFSYIGEENCLGQASNQNREQGREQILENEQNSDKHHPKQDGSRFHDLEKKTIKSEQIQSILLAQQPLATKLFICFKTCFLFTEIDIKA